MAKKKVEKDVVTVEMIMPEVEVVPTPIDKLSVDFPSEGLNNMARKINEIIDRM